MNEIVNEMIARMKQQIQHPALSNSRFVFDEVLHMDVDFYRLNLMRGSSYLPLGTDHYFFTRPGVSKTVKKIVCTK